MSTTATRSHRATAKEPERQETGAPLRPRRWTAERWTAVGFLAPLAVYLVAFYLFPLYRNVELSLHDYTPIAFVQGNAEFVGFRNFADVFASRTFGTALVNTTLFTLISIAFQFVIGLALAVFFRKAFPLSGGLRALFLVPWLLPLIVSGSVWAWLFNSENGVINAALRILGMDPVNWLVSPDTALTSVIIANIWLGIPFNLVVLYSGLQNIPDEVYEAAMVDGASAWRTFWSVTLPLLKPVAAITLLLGFVYTLKVVDIVWIMTTGGPADASTTFATWSYREAFGTGNPEFSPAAAVGNILILIALAVGAIYIRLQRRMDAS
jgi:multiple sugar transport system permease protein